MSIDIWQNALRPAAHVVGRRLEDTFFLVNLESNSVFELNATGTEIWLWLEQNNSLTACLDHLCAKFVVDIELLRQQVGPLVEELLREGLLEQSAVERAPVIEVIPLARSSTKLPMGSWILRWEPNGDEPVLEMGAGEALDGVEVIETAAGNIVVFDGYLFDLPMEGNARKSAARHVAAAFEARGDDFLRELRGGFFTAIWDRKNARLVAARDGMGVHPAYFYWNERTLLLSSSVDALLAQPEVQRRPHVIRIAEFLLGSSFSHHLQETFYQDIRRLPPAHQLAVRGTTLSVARYWNPIPIGFEWATKDELAEFEPTLRRAVARCLGVGAQAVALSGGFDSVGIAAVAAELRGTSAPLSALSVRFPDTEINEEATQAQVARVLGMPQHFPNGKSRGA